MWLDFGLDILLRFAMLSYNCVEWGNGTLRLAALSPSVINRSLACCTLFWAMLVLGFVLLVRRPTAGPLTVARAFDVPLSPAVAIPMALLASIIFYFVEGQTSLPLVLITPLALLANLYMVPAAIVWWDHFRQGTPWWKVGVTPVIVLLPAVVRSWRSPYRENLAPLLVIPLIAAFYAGQTAIASQAASGRPGVLFDSHFNYRSFPPAHVGPRAIGIHSRRDASGGCGGLDHRKLERTATEVSCL